MQSGKMRFTSLLLILLAAVSIFACMQYQQNQRYEKYLSLRLSNNLSKITSGIILGNNLLMEIIESEEISYTQFSRLKNRMQWIGTSGNDMIDLANLVVPNQITSNEVLGASNNIRHYLRTQFEDKFTANTNVLHLEQDELSTLKNFQMLTNLWAAELEKHIKIINIPDSKYLQGGVFLENRYPFDVNEFRNQYTKDGINKKDWQELMYGIERICNENKNCYRDI